MWVRRSPLPAAAAVPQGWAHHSSNPSRSPPPPSQKKKEGAEQKRARLEVESLAAAEGEAARQAAARATIRDRAEREAALTALNAPRLAAEWPQRMRGTKLEELQAEAGALSRAHDAEVDRRDRLLEALLEDVAVQNAAHDAAAASHADVLDSLLQLHRDRMAALHRQFGGDLKGLQAEFDRWAAGRRGWVGGRAGGRGINHVCA
jgi:hypothetical protein